MSRSRSVLQGIANVPIQPSASADGHYTNNITITTNPESVEVRYPGDDLNAVQGSSHGLMSDTKSPGPYSDLVTARDVNDNAKVAATGTVKDYLLQLYQSILLNQDKKLLANLVSRNQIVLTKEDLEEVIRRQTGKTCSIEIEDPDITCCGMSAPFLKIDTIKIIDDSTPNGVDYTIKYNSDYLDLNGTYRLCTKFVLAN